MDANKSKPALFRVLESVPFFVRMIPVLVLLNDTPCWEYLKESVIQSFFFLVYLRQSYMVEGIHRSVVPRI